MALNLTIELSAIVTGFAGIALGWFMAWLYMRKR